MMAIKYIPSSIEEVREMLGAMVLCMPDIEIPNSGLDMAGAYAELEESFGIVRKQLGDERYQQLMTMARQSHQHFIDGDEIAGSFLLQDMQKLLHKHKAA
jgi:hypothetical protein